MELNSLSSSYDGDVVVLTSSEEESNFLYSQIQFFTSNRVVLHLPSLDSLPYDRVSPSSGILSARASSLTKLNMEKGKKIIVTNAINILVKYPFPQDLTNCYKKITVGDKITSQEIENFLLCSSYQRTSEAVDPGEFARRGEILDIVLFSGNAYRLNFGWNIVESIRLYQVESQTSKEKQEEIEIYPASELILNQKNIENYKNNFLKFFGIMGAKERYFTDIDAGIKIQGIESIAPMFYETDSSLFDYTKKPKTFLSLLVEQSLKEYALLYEDFYQARLNAKKVENNFYPTVNPDFLIYKNEEILSQIKDKSNITQEPVNDYVFMENFVHISLIKSTTPIELFLDCCSAQHNKIPVICCSSFFSMKQIEALLTSNDIRFKEISNLEEAIPNVINLTILNIYKGFICNSHIIASDVEIIGQRRYSVKSSKAKLKNIFKEIESFYEGDLVVHIDHGIGRYEGIEPVIVDQVQHDCLKIIYAKGDRLFIPVENINLLKRYGSNDIELDNLGGVNWQKRKAKLQEKIGDIALNLIKIAAKRSIINVPSINKSDSDYQLFCKKFPYIETEDQIRAIEDIQEDLEKTKPMDRLVCGDVGFGKTEVAMRAAFLVAGDKSKKRQVAIIVPTTILSRQHYNNFEERFYGFGIKIAQISRFVSKKEADKTKEAIKIGDVDIIIGTHALLVENIKFKNLALVIVDEEQHFGVLQKEKLKDLKESIHCLTLSATPIPRTLQMSLLGIKDLSLIATPPIDRLPIKTSLISYDEVVIRDALLREKFRGGKSFFVCPRVSDLEEISRNLKTIVPELSLKIIHGQMRSQYIDDIMTEFYEGTFDILLSTAIVESGLDVPSANTMIIYKAEMFGLSQLYQLRGRVGRGKVRGYGYLVLDRKKMPTKSALKRLSIMESLNSLGAGFSIASHDMDLRGFGNLVGDEQSGHIKEVGVELYQEMLEEAIEVAKDERVAKINTLPSVKINIPIYIPDEYIEDQDLRLGVYRRIGDTKTIEEIEDFKVEFLDRFGEIPQSVFNLLDIMEIKITLAKLEIKYFEIGSGGINIQFSSLADVDKIMGVLARYPRNTKLKPDNKLVIIKQIDPAHFLKEVKLFIKNFQ